MSFIIWTHVASLEDADARGHRSDERDVAAVEQHRPAEGEDLKEGVAVGRHGGNVQHVSIDTRRLDFPVCLVSVCSDEKLLLEILPILMNLIMYHRGLDRFPHVSADVPEGLDVRHAGDGVEEDDSQRGERRTRVAQH
jgi:hypothetical protein